MNRYVVPLLCIVCLAGCTKLEHLEQLLTLKAVSDERDLQSQYVEAQNEKFDQLLEAVKNGQVETYADQASFLTSFGDPIFTRQEERNGQTYEMWLYRYATKYFDSEKVYLFFDENGTLKDWEHYVPLPKEENPA